MKKILALGGLVALVAILFAGATLLNLQTQVTGVLPIVNGGLNNNATPAADGQLPIWNAAGQKYIPGDPIVSFNYANLTGGTSAAATGSYSGPAARLSTFGAYGSLYVSFAGITGSPSGCTLQLKNWDSTGNNILNGAAISVTPATGITSYAITPAAGLQTAAQMSVIYTCTGYPSAGTMVIEFVPGVGVGILGNPVLGTGSAKIGVVTTDQTTHGTTDLVAGDITKLGGVAVGASNPFFVSPGTGATFTVTATALTDLDATIGTPGSAVPAKLSMGGLKDPAGNARASLSDTNGRQFMLPYPNTTTASYAAAATWSPVVTSATDILRIPGNATNTVLVTYVEMSCTATTAGGYDVLAIKRSTAGSGGTSSSMSLSSDDSSFGANSSTPVTYTVNPTVGTIVGNVSAKKITFLATSTASASDVFILNRRNKPIALHGTAENLVLNLNSQSIAGLACDAQVEWMETTTP